MGGGSPSLSVPRVPEACTIPAYLDLAPLGPAAARQLLEPSAPSSASGPCGAGYGHTGSAWSAELPRTGREGKPPPPMIPLLLGLSEQQGRDLEVEGAIQGSEETIWGAEETIWGAEGSSPAAPHPPTCLSPSLFPPIHFFHMPPFTLFLSLTTHPLLTHLLPISSCQSRAVETLITGPPGSFASWNTGGLQIGYFISVNTQNLA